MKSEIETIYTATETTKEESETVPVSIKREFYYRAVIEETGEQIYCDTLKHLYSLIRSQLRADVLYLEDGFRCASAMLEFGVETLYEDGSGNVHSEWTQLDHYGCLYVSTASEVFYRYIDNSECIIRGK